MKVALVGFGTAGEARVAAYRTVPDASVVAVVDPSPLRRARAAALLPGATVHADLDALLAGRAAGAVDVLDGVDAVDVVDICAPPVFHVPYARAALASGHHVICEKPVAFTGDEARELVTLSRQRGRLFYPVHNYVFSPMMEALAEAVPRPADGVPMELTIEILRPRHAVGVEAWQADWRTDAAVAGGGILLDHGTHCVYMATRLFGATPEKVACVMRRAGGTAAAGDRAVDVRADLRMEFPNGVCEIVLSWISEVRSNRYRLSTGAGTVDVLDDLVVVDGPGGRVERGLMSPTASSTHEEWFAAMFADFTEAVGDRTKRERPLDEALSTVLITEAAYRSARQGGLPVGLG
ncbi:Gfo/Idh/MocA family protein [Streptomyces sp. URMC 124]|uniref:Gfo/Idh/MocA family protein n=1 Tax=Streptomyces sp. URMC 124 TaxID=3423405 RepID=UPI003F1A30B4